MNTIVERTRTPAPSFKREPSAGPPGNLFLRSITARAIGHVLRAKPEEIAAERWPADKALANILRAASAPALTTVAGWAAELAQLTVAMLEALAPASCGADILRRGLVLTFDRYGAISAPGFVADYANAGFVAEGQPIPVHEMALNLATLLPYKLGALAVLTREMIESSNAEALIGDVIVRSIGRMLDEVLVDANPAGPSRPAGLRHGIAATAASANANAYDAALEDIAALVNAVAPVAGNGPYCFITSPGRAVGCQLRFFQTPSVTFYGSNAVINDMLCVAPAALVSAISGEPELETSKAATLHMDTAPSQDIAGKAPVRSLWQTDSIAIKGRWPISWALRDPRGFAWTTPTWK